MSRYDAYVAAVGEPHWVLECVLARLTEEGARWIFATMPPEAMAYLQRTIRDHSWYAEWNTAAHEDGEEE
jgi:hypothetical protein